MNVQPESLIAALVLAGAYLVGGRLDASDASERFWARRRYISAAAGISVAYIFIDVLPELELQRKVVVGAAQEELRFAQQRVYILALLSFVVMYGLQHMVLVERRDRNANDPAGEAPDPFYWVQLGGFAAYSAIIGYLLVDRVERGALSVTAYTFAMAVHFLIVDHALTEEHPGIYGRRDRCLLAASVIAGWLVAVFAPLPEVLVARLFAILAGGVVITSLRAELPDDRVGRFWPFCLSAVAFAAFLMLT